jgi:hypothetical protein
MGIKEAVTGRDFWFAQSLLFLGLSVWYTAEKTEPRWMLSLIIANMVISVLNFAAKQR